MLKRIYIMTIRYGIQKQATTSYVSNEESDNFKSFFDKHLAHARLCREKDGKTFVPSFFRQPKRLESEVSATTMVVFDIDQTPQDDIISLEEIEDVMLDMCIEHAVYTSFSNTPECPRFRLIIPLSRPAYPSEFKQVAAAMLEELDEFLDGRLAKVVDQCWKEISRCYFTFTVHPDRQNGSVSFYNPGRAADTDELKLRSSSYSLVSDSQSSSCRTGVIGSGAGGRSYELNRLLSAMYKTTSDEEIAQRVFEFDREHHSDKPYFSDHQYSRNRPQPGETQDQASWRACQSFVRSHLGWLRRKDKNEKFEIIDQRGVNSGPLPPHDAAIMIWKVEDQTSSGKQRIKLSCKVMSGKYAGCIFWHTLFGSGYSEKSEKIAEKMAERLGAATKTEVSQPVELTKIVGRIFIGRVKRVAGTNGYPDQNQIGGVYPTKHTGNAVTYL